MMITTENDLNNRNDSTLRSHRQDLRARLSEE